MNVQKDHSNHDQISPFPWVAIPEIKLLVMFVFFFLAQELNAIFILRFDILLIEAGHSYNLFLSHIL